MEAEAPTADRKGHVPPRGGRETPAEVAPDDKRRPEAARKRHVASLVEAPMGCTRPFLGV